ncbi:MAG: hypothetical protein WC980_09400 [Candidatus Brocadiia bacterium]
MKKYLILVLVLSVVILLLFIIVQGYREGRFHVTDFSAEQNQAGYWWLKLRGHIRKEYIKGDYTWGEHFSHHGYRTFKIKTEDIPDGKGQGILDYLETCFRYDYPINKEMQDLLNKSLGKPNPDYKELKAWWLKNKATLRYDPVNDVLK